jgi:hypothetical protein
MKGTVKPHARPTRRNERITFIVGGGGGPRDGGSDDGEGVVVMVIVSVLCSVL